MNTTSDSFYDGSSRDLGGKTIVGFGFGVGLFIAFVIIFVVITYISYKCKRMGGGATNLNHRSLASINAATTNNNDFSIVTIQPNGLDEATLSSYPRFAYSQVKPPKSDSNASACSICLADYKELDLLRMLPDCGHLFHLNCIDPWLVLHPTCPVCRTSPLPTSHS